MKTLPSLPFEVPEYYQCPHCLGEAFRLSKIHHDRLICTHCWRSEPLTKPSYYFLLSLLGNGDPLLLFQIPADIARIAQLKNTPEEETD